MAKQAVNGWFQDLVTSAAKPVFGFLGATVLGTPEIDSGGMARARQLWGASQVIANTCFVLVVSIAGVLLMAGQSLPGQVSPKELLPRVVLAFGAVNLSLTFIGYGISFANGLAQAFLSSGPSKVDAGVVADTLGASIAATALTGGVFMPMVALAVIVLALVVTFIYIVRLAITMVLIAAAPLALMFHALPMTDGLARLWWRGITGILAIQVCQALALVTAFQLLFSEVTDSSGSVVGVPTRTDLTDLLVAIALLWVMIRIPSWVARTVWQPAQPRLLGQMLKTFVLYRGIGALMNKTGRSVPAGAGTKPDQGRHRPPSGKPTPRPTRPRRQPTRLQPTHEVVHRQPRPPTPPEPPEPRRPPQAAPPGWNVSADSDTGVAGRAVQLALPISVRPKPGTARPAQLALPIPVTRVPRPPAPPPVSQGRPRVRSRQLMLPGMPRRPVPPRQLALRLELPKQHGRKA
ncbi:type IV secretion system protein [Thermomonospora echinospora]|nr:type IV secretion system protein [Thermomonospora echinospora]